MDCVLPRWYPRGGGAGRRQRLPDRSSPRRLWWPHWTASLDGHPHRSRSHALATGTASPKPRPTGSAGGALVAIYKHQGPRDNVLGSPGDNVPSRTHRTVRLCESPITLQDSVLRAGCLQGRAVSTRGRRQGQTANSRAVAASLDIVLRSQSRLPLGPPTAEEDIVLLRRACPRQLTGRWGRTASF